MLVMIAHTHHHPPPCTTIPHPAVIAHMPSIVACIWGASFHFLSLLQVAFEVIIQTMGAFNKTAQGTAVLEAIGNAGAEAALRRRQLLMENRGAQLGKYQRHVRISKGRLMGVRQPPRVPPSTPRAAPSAAAGTLGGASGSGSGPLGGSSGRRSAAESGGPQHQDTPRPGKGAERKRSGRK